MDLDALRIFLHVAETASFTQAADRMGLTRARVSAVVQRLEAEFGTRLFHRTTRTVQITDDGRLLAERAQSLLGEAEEVQSLFQRQPAALQGRIRADVPLLMASRVIIPRLPEFLARHPRLEVDLSSTDRRVDLVREGFDCVVRVGALQDSGLVARRLGELPQSNFASPAYLERFGTPHNLEDLAHHRLVRYAADLGGGPAAFEYMEGGTLRTLPMTDVVTVNNSLAYEAACLAGLGIVQAPVSSPRRDLLATGQLVEILPHWRPPTLPVTLLYPHRRHVPRRVQAFMDWLAEVVEQSLPGARDA